MGLDSGFRITKEKANEDNYQYGKYTDVLDYRKKYILHWFVLQNYKLFHNVEYVVDFITISEDLLDKLIDEVNWVIREMEIGASEVVLQKYHFMYLDDPTENLEELKVLKENLEWIKRERLQSVYEERMIYHFS